MTERADTQFDIDKYLRNIKPLDLNQFNWEEVARHPLKPEEARILVYMRDIEAHTPWYQGNLLLTRAADDPEATAFLMNWGFQEYRHGEVLGRFLGEAGYRLPLCPNILGTILLSPREEKEMSGFVDK